MTVDKWDYIKQYQQAGAYVFMALPNQKYNAVEGGFNNSFANGDELRQWITQHPEYQNGNVGIDLSKSNLVVVDIDKHEQNGMASILAWFKSHNVNPDTLQDTYVEQTPTGGLHAHKSIIRNIFYLGLNRLGNFYFWIGKTDSFVVEPMNILGHI